MGGSDHTETVINNTIVVNVPADHPNSPPQPFVDTLIKNLKLMFNGVVQDVSGDSQKDLQLFYQLLENTATQEFKGFFGYDFNDENTMPIDMKDDSFHSHKDKTNCPTTDQQRIDQYVDNQIFGPNSEVPAAVEPGMRNDLLGVLRPLLTNGPLPGWQSFPHNRRYHNEGKADIEVNVAFVWTIVNAVNNNGDLVPTLFLQYVGGFFHAKDGL